MYNIQSIYNYILFFFLGIVFIQSFFIAYQYIITKRKEFIYYLSYVILMTVLICFNSKPDWSDALGLVTAEGQFYLARATLIFALSLYYGFGRHFCDMNVLHPKQHYFQFILEKGMILFSIFDLITCTIYKDYFFPDFFVKIFIVLLMIYSIYIIWFLATRKSILNTILVSGSSLLLLGGIVYAIEYMRTNNSLDGFYYMQFYVYGVILEFLFLNFGLIYKSKLIQLEHNRIISEKHFQFQTQRNQLVDDLQDEVGGGLSSIRMTSEFLLANHLSNDLKVDYLKKIISTIDKVSNEMKVIVWSLNTSNDTVENTLEYIAQCGTTLFEQLKIVFKFINQVDHQIPIMINGLSRKNLFSICKFIFIEMGYNKNISNVFLHVTKQNELLVIRISNDDKNKSPNDNTININLNIDKLIKEINGLITIEHHNGTIITISCPIIA